MSTIHELIRSGRERKGWSMERLAAEVSKAEGLKKPLSWQTVQQWENGNSAPRRDRMMTVMEVLGVAPSYPRAVPARATEATPYGAKEPETGNVYSPELTALHLLNKAAQGVGGLDRAPMSKRATILAMMFDEMEDGPFKERAYILCQQVMLGFDPQSGGSTASSPKTAPAREQ